MPSLKPYAADLPYSYAAGVYPSLTLMETAPERAMRLLLSDKADGEGVAKLRKLCAARGVREEIAPKVLSRILQKDNIYAAVVFWKREATLYAGRAHIVLHHPMDEGNLGTIQRTMLGFGLSELAIIRPAADPFDPKVVRATMGAVFSLNIRQYATFADYRAEFSAHALYPFMLDGAVPLDAAAASRQTPYALVFGSEGAGLPPEFQTFGQAVKIPQSEKIDSLNLAVSVAIAAYTFTR